MGNKTCSICWWWAWDDVEETTVCDDEDNQHYGVETDENDSCSSWKAMPERRGETTESWATQDAIMQELHESYCD